MRASFWRRNSCDGTTRSYAGRSGPCSKPTIRTRPKSWQRLIDLLEVGDVKEAWRSPRSWYAAANKKHQEGPATSQWKIDGGPEGVVYEAPLPPPGRDSILCNVERQKVDDLASYNMTLRGFIKRARYGRARPHDGMRAKDLKEWVCRGNRQEE